MSFPRFLHSKIFLALVAWRICSVFIVQTSHVPDEFWQSLEVAHKLAFDYGYLTWEWRIGIRSYLYPYLISVLYSFLKILKLDYTYLLITLPRVFQALLCSYAEYKFYIWTDSKFALFNLCINWYWYYCATRTLINSFETCLTIIALSEYPWKDNPRKNSKFLWTVGFLCFVRPTAAAIWLPLCLYHLAKSKTLFTRYLLVGVFYLIVSTLVDVMCYGRFILTPLEFFKVNVVNSISEQYGKMHLLWYFTSGLPIILGLNYVLLPLAVFKIYKDYSHLHKSALLALATIWSLGIYSLLAHKEFRFILPLLPMFIYIINESTFLQKTFESKKKIWIVLLVISNVLPGFYFSVLHQQGALKVMNHLRHDIQTSNASDVDILFLTTCHATPYYSHLHKNVSMKFLTCEPNLEGIKDYYDETDVFFMNPLKWLETNYLNKSISTLPSHVITYDSTVEHIRPFLKFYKKITTYKDTHFSQHGNFNCLAKDSDKSLDEICEALDNLAIRNLELIEEKVLINIQLEHLLRQGHIDLAKARYIRGKESVGMLQVPSEENDMKSLFDLETNYVKDNNKDTEIPSFDISLKKSDKEEVQDPIKWFGVLVPQSLKAAQKHFQDALYLIVKLANIQAQLSKVRSETASLKLSKKVVV